MSRVATISLLGDWAPETWTVEHPELTGLTLINLEGPFLEDAKSVPTPPKKAGPKLSNQTLPESDNQLCFSLANNHLMDFGYGGLSSTLAELSRIGALSCGAGTEIGSARKAARIKLEEFSISVIAVTEAQFGQAGINRPGVLPLDSDVTSLIRREKLASDFVILSAHSGSEMSPWPSLQRRNLFRSYIDSGASVIWGHHSHVPQSWEEYGGGVIFYGLGNYAVRPDKWEWHPNALWSLSPTIQLSTSGISLEIGTHVISGENSRIKVRKSRPDELANHMAYLDRVNSPLFDDQLLIALSQHGATRLYDNFFEAWLGFRELDDEPSFPMSMLRLKKLVSLLIGKSRSEGRAKQRQHLWYHLFACESHREAISIALGLRIGELEDVREVVDCTTWLCDLMIKPEEV